ncbi:unnamed protein product, partial [Ectocarpus sp. 6 AP-2014]
ISTLASWGDSSRLRIQRLGNGGNSGKRIYNVADIETQLGCDACPDKSQKEFIIYARVSSSKQSEDLERQVASLQESCPHHTTLKDIGPGLNYKAKTLRPIWNASALEMSRRLLSPTEIGSVGTDLNSSSLSAKSTARRSWSTTNQKLRGHNKNSLKIPWPSAICLSRGTTAEREEEANSVSDARSRKIKLDPTPEWKERLRKWMGTARWTYNRCLDFLNTKKCSMNKTGFRRKVVGGWNHGDEKRRTGKKKKKKRGKNRENWSKPKNTSKRDCKTSWVLETPFEIRDSAMVDLYDGVVTNLKKREKNPTHTFSMTFRSKTYVQTIKIPGRCVKDGYMFKKSCGTERLKGFEDWASYKGEIIIQRDRVGNFYACVTEQSKMVPPRVKYPEDPRVAALDPGVRTFNTAVDSKGNVTEFAPGDVGRTYRLCHHMDKLQSKAFNKATPSRKRYNLRK